MIAQRCKNGGMTAGSRFGVDGTWSGWGEVGRSGVVSTNQNYWKCCSISIDFCGGTGRVLNYWSRTSRWYPSARGITLSQAHRGAQASSIWSVFTQFLRAIQTSWGERASLISAGIRQCRRKHIWGVFPISVAYSTCRGSWRSTHSCVQSGWIFRLSLLRHNADSWRIQPNVHQSLTLRCFQNFGIYSLPISISARPQKDHVERPKIRPEGIVLVLNTEEKSQVCYFFQSSNLHQKFFFIFICGAV